MELVHNGCTCKELSVDSSLRLLFHLEDLSYAESVLIQKRSSLSLFILPSFLCHGEDVLYPQPETVSRQTVVVFQH